MVLRIEDTDQRRYVEGAMQRFLEDLAWLGIEIDEGPEQQGPYAPYVQSERVERHRTIAHELVARGAAYYEFGATETAGTPRSDEEYRRRQGPYRGATRSRPEPGAQGKIARGEPYIVRLKAPESGTIVVDDLVRGSVSFEAVTLDDAVLLKSDGMPTYHLAAMVDDHDMGITHVMRSEEWLPSTPKHLLIFEALGWEAPQFAHLPLLLAADGKKLSKRIHGEAVWVRTYREQGYLPEAFVNYLALLGWNPGNDQESFTLPELIEAFSLDRVHKAGAKFDAEKLDAFQRRVVASLPIADLIGRVQPFLSKPIESVLLEKLVRVVRPRLGKLADFLPSIQFFLNLPEYDPALLVFRKSTTEKSQRGLALAHQALADTEHEAWQQPAMLQAILERVIARSAELGNADVFWPVRVALTGQERSPSPSECLWVLGREESLRRLGQAQKTLQELRI